MPDHADGLSAEVIERLQQEEIIWFTTVSPRGVPVPNPVWFYWDGEYLLVYSEPTSFRVRNIQNNPHVAITLQGVDGLGNNVVIINGEAELRPNNPSIPEGYWKKFKKHMQDMTPAQMTAAYNVEIRVKPARVRTS